MATKDEKYAVVESILMPNTYLAVGPDGPLYRKKDGYIRRFKTRAGARKAITRQKRGDFHR